MEKKARITAKLLLYLKQTLGSIVFFFVIFLILWVNFYLSGIEPVVYGYGMVLCLFAGGIALASGFFSFSRKYRYLMERIEGICDGSTGLPQAVGAIEQAYQEIYARVLLEKEKGEREKDRERSGLISYYTLWAHQIKTPIAAMRLLLQGEKDHSGITATQELEAELFKIEQYVGMVLIYLQTQDKQTDYVFSKYPLDDLIRQSVRKYAKLFIQKKISLDFRETGFTVLTDEKWLCFVIGQLLSNALKYTNEGAISIYGEEENTFVIQDTGIGISPEDLPRIFENGYTGFNGRMEKKSTGIGLYLCRKIMKNLGHTIEITSVQGKGTKVKLSLVMMELD